MFPLFLRRGVVRIALRLAERGRRRNGNSRGLAALKVAGMGAGRGEPAVLELDDPAFGGNPGLWCAFVRMPAGLNAGASDTPR